STTNPQRPTFPAASNSSGTISGGRPLRLCKGWGIAQRATAFFRTNTLWVPSAGSPKLIPHASSSTIRTSNKPMRLSLLPLLALALTSPAQPQQHRLLHRRSPPDVALPSTHRPPRPLQIQRWRQDTQNPGRTAHPLSRLRTQLQIRRLASDAYRRRRHAARHDPHLHHHRKLVQLLP